MASERKSVSKRECAHRISVDRYCYLCDMNNQGWEQESIRWTARRLDQIEEHLRDVFFKLESHAAATAGGRKCPWCDDLVVPTNYGLADSSGRIHICGK